MATLAPSLVRLRSEINRAFQHRDKTSDGWIADARHASTSDHQPDEHGIVHAIDIDVDDGDPTKDLRKLLIRRAIAHPSTHYIISNDVIYNRDHGFQARKYEGTNGHYHHVHISILHTKAAETSTHAWGISSTYPLLRYGSHGARVKAYIAGLVRLGYHQPIVDTYQSPAVKGTKLLQKAHGREQTGVAGEWEQKAVGL